MNILCRFNDGFRDVLLSGLEVGNMVPNVEENTVNISPNSESKVFCQGGFKGFNMKRIMIFEPTSLWSIRSGLKTT